MPVDVALPYTLTRADELAVVRNQKRTHLNEMIEIELRSRAQEVNRSEKLDSKVVRHGRTALRPGAEKDSSPQNLCALCVSAVLLALHQERP